MHDLLEGICRYDIALLLRYFIYIKKLISLEDFNSKVRSFDYGPGYNVNKPTELTEKSIKNRYITLSSSEMLYLVLNINLIIGPLVSEDSEEWQLYLSLRELVIIISSRKLHLFTYKYLESVIFEYVSFLVSCFPDFCKPKHHFLVHYPRCMRLFGPLCKICCIRFESKNQEGKCVAKSTTSRVNINKTIAIKHQLDLNYRFITKNVSDPIIQSKNHKLKISTSLADFEKYSHLKSSSRVLSVKIVLFYDKVIRKNSVIMLASSSGPVFKIVHEIIFKDQKHVFVTKKLNDFRNAILTNI